MRKSTASSRTKVVQCYECGSDVTVGANQRKAVRCLDCTTEAMANAAREMHNKSGETYAKWQSAMRAMIDRGY